MLKTTFFALALAAASGFVNASVLRERGPCHENNCWRQILGTGFGIERKVARVSDCGSFQGCSITPSATVVTAYETITTGVTTITLNKNTALPTGTAAETTCKNAKPTYAFNCVDFDEWSSVCACGGVTAASTTLPQPIKTATVTATRAAETVYA